MAVLLGLVVALTYGTGDFFGGLAARRVPVLWVVFLSHALAAVLVVGIVAFDRSSAPTRHDIVIGVVAGLVGMAAVALFYRGLAIGRMGVVAPITAVVSAIVPVAWGLAFGERPSGLALTGVALAIGSVALISSEAGDPPHDLGTTNRRLPIVLALAAGVGFGVFFVLYSNAGEHSGMWPLLASRWTSATFLALVLLFIPRARRDPPSRRALPLIAGAGLFDAAANGVFLVAARSGLLSIVGAVSSLYPASTVLLARAVLHERFHRAQVIGLSIAAIGVVLIAIG
ncbi:MAG TPA: DMT family transporter [Acidimicrobiales bacterium]|nr:DMT family transporter [Acidimicrobiales bacterium]